MIGSSLARLRSMRDRMRRSKRLQGYIRGGQTPWSDGYVDFRDDRVLEVLRDPQQLGLFRSGARLPLGFGLGLDERIVEYPWTLSRLDPSESLLLDAGSALNHQFLIDDAALQKKKIVFYTLAPESLHSAPNLSYVFGDLRATILNDRTFNEIVCISTLEHIGMDNTRLYTSDPHMNEQNPTDFQLVMKEFHRLLVPGGQLIFTVPYGRPENLGWLQVFDTKLLDTALSSFGGEVVDEAFYRYTAEGWIVSDREGCTDCGYFDVHSQEYVPGRAAAAGGVACFELRRSVESS